MRPHSWFCIHSIIFSASNDRLVLCANIEYVLMQTAEPVTHDKNKNNNTLIIIITTTITVFTVPVLKSSKHLTTMGWGGVGGGGVLYVKSNKANIYSQRHTEHTLTHTHTQMCVRTHTQRHTYKHAHTHTNYKSSNDETCQ